MSAVVNAGNQPFVVDDNAEGDLVDATKRVQQLPKGRKFEARRQVCLAAIQRCQELGLRLTSENLVELTGSPKWWWLGSKCAVAEELTAARAAAGEKMLLAPSARAEVSLGAVLSALKAIAEDPTAPEPTPALVAERAGVATGTIYGGSAMLEAVAAAQAEWRRRPLGEGEGERYVTAGERAEAALEELLAEDVDPAGITTRMVAERAGISPASVARTRSVTDRLTAFRTLAASELGGKPVPRRIRDTAIRFGLDRLLDAKRISFETTVDRARALVDYAEWCDAGGDEPLPADARRWTAFLQHCDGVGIPQSKINDVRFGLINAHEALELGDPFGQPRTYRNAPPPGLSERAAKYKEIARRLIVDRLYFPAQAEEYRSRMLDFGTLDDPKCRRQAVAFGGQPLLLADAGAAPGSVDVIEPGSVADDGEDHDAFMESVLLEIQAAIETQGHAIAGNTEKTYTSNIQYLLLWGEMKEYRVSLLPMTPLALVAFLWWRSRNGTLSVSSIRAAMAAVSYIHRIRDLPDPVASATVDAFVAGYENRFGRERQAAAHLEVHELYRVHARWLGLWRSSNDLRALRRATMLSVGYAMSSRGSEYTTRRGHDHPDADGNPVELALRIEDLDFDDCDDFVKVHVRKTKTSKSGEVTTKRLSRQFDEEWCPVADLRRWLAELAKLGVTSGPLFPALVASGIPTARSWEARPDAMRAAEWGKELRDGCVAVGLNPKRAASVRTHSLRRSAIRNALLGGAPVSAVQRQASVKNLNTIGLYAQELDDELAGDTTAALFRQ